MLLLGLAAPAAFAGDDNDSAVMADCGVADLPAAAIDSCLERVRVLDETEPSPHLQALEARLEERATGQPTRGGAEPDRRPAASGTDSYGAGAYDSGTAEDAQQPAMAEPDSGATLSTQSPAPLSAEQGAEQEYPAQQPSARQDRSPDADAEDEPPIEDPPDAPGGRAADESQPQPDDPQ
ncbi:MAG TPA: hypothetical protein VIY09_01575 [Rhizomicrobium sp.]